MAFWIRSNSPSFPVWVARRRARSSGAAERYTLSSASGRTTVPMSLPSTTAPPRLRACSAAARCTGNNTSRSSGFAETFEAAAETSGALRSGSGTRTPSMRAPSGSSPTRLASPASRDPSSRFAPSRMARSAAARYAAPVLRLTTPRRPATARATELFPLPAGPSMATSMPPIDAGSIAERPAASPQGFQRPEVTRKGLCHASRVPDPDARGNQPRYRKRHRHPVVAVSAYHSRAYLIRYYVDRCGGCLCLYPEAVQFGCDGGEAVRLLQTRMSYVLYGGRAFSERCDCRECDHGVRERVHVDFDAAQVVRPLYVDEVRGNLDPTAHVAQHACEAQVSLWRRCAETWNPHAPASYGRRRHKVGRSRGVRLHLVCPRGVKGWGDGEAFVCFVYLHAEGPHQRHCDADVGPFFPAHGVERDRSLCVRCRHQQPADELAALARRHARLPAGDPAALYHKREPSVFSCVLHLSTELPHPVYEICDRALAHPGNSVHGERAPAKGEKWRQETGNRARVADKEVYASCVDLTALAAYVDFSPLAVGLYVDAEADEGVHEPEGVVREEWVDDPGISVREGGDDECAVGDTLGTRDSYRRIRRPFQRHYFELSGERWAYVPHREIHARHSHGVVHRRASSSEAVRARYSPSGRSPRVTGPTRVLCRESKDSPKAIQALRIMRLRPSWIVKSRLVVSLARLRLVIWGACILPSSRVGLAASAVRAALGTGFSKVRRYCFSISDEGWVILWATLPSFVRMSRPVVAASRRPAGTSPGTSGIRWATVLRPRSSFMVVKYPAGLFRAS